MAEVTQAFRTKLNAFIADVPGPDQAVNAGSPAWNRLTISVKYMPPAKLPGLSQKELDKLPKEQRDLLKATRAQAAKDRAAEIASDQREMFAVTNNEVFTKLTGLTHAQIVQNWMDGGQLTSCNSFCGTYGGAMGAPFFLGRFNVDEFLKGQGKSSVWVAASSGEKPGFGDIFEHSDRLHQGVSLGVSQTGEWLTVEGGQGGPALGYDRVMRKSRKFDPGVLKGWVVVAKLVGGVAGG